MTTRKSKAMAFLDAQLGEPLTLGSLLSTLRTCDEISQAALAQRLGVSKSHLCDIEKGRKSVSPERAARFARELGYSEEQFVRLALQQMMQVAGLQFRVVLTLLHEEKTASPARRTAPSARRRGGGRAA